MQKFPLVANFKVSCHYHMEAFGDWLRGELKNRGLKQADLARMIGKPSATVSRYVTQSRLRPSDEILQLIAKALKYPPEEVYWRARRLPKKADDSLSPQLMQLFEIISDWPEDRQQALLEIAEVMERRLNNEPGELQSTRVAAGRSAT